MNGEAESLVRFASPGITNPNGCRLKMFRHKTVVDKNQSHTYCFDLNMGFKSTEMIAVEVKMISSLKFIGKSKHLQMCLYKYIVSLTCPRWRTKHVQTEGMLPAKPWSHHPRLQKLFSVLIWSIIQHWINNLSYCCATVQSERYLSLDGDGSLQRFL